MIPSLIVLIGILFGASGDVQVFYVDKLEQGVKKYVEEKSVKKEVLDTMKVYSKEVGKFYKERDKSIKEFKKIAADRSTSRQELEEFFNNELKKREQLTESFINKRLFLQKELSQQEWDDIIALGSKVQDKQDAKEAKRSKKKETENMSKNQRQLREHIADADRQGKSLAALEELGKQYNAIADRYEKINVNDSEALTNRNISRDQLELLRDGLITQRKEMIVAYLNFYETLKENTTEEEWNKLIKEANKLIE